ncbi:amino acid ABC transporter permease [Methanocalculus sp.]|uniref:amino acid ABC transporter permease n=1 Tax=Methanocalculus sp. TaxID=2004547 RepID=UPI002725D10F|nr:amino acid ABC transporter permease [Methanocalculus sp.]MDO8841217.1 amino acid ABC transporter permease [Methanocalculus sp.]
MSFLSPAIIESLPYLLSGIFTTLGLVILALALGLLMGIPMALFQVYGPSPLKYLVRTYIWIFRGLPILVLLFLFYFGIFPMLGFHIEAFWIAAIVLGFRTAAYQSEIFRGAILSIKEGQMLAARSLGMSRWQAIRTIILPQALRNALPGWTNEYPILLTDSSVCYAIGVAELLTRGNQIIARIGDPMTVYIVVAIIFILLNYGGQWIFGRIEHRYKIPGYGRGDI